MGNAIGLRYVVLATADNDVTSRQKLLELRHTDLAESNGRKNDHDKGHYEALSADPQVDVFNRDELAKVANT